jgi:hypothetical protein
VIPHAAILTYQRIIRATWPNVVDDSPRDIRVRELRPRLLSIWCTSSEDALYSFAEGSRRERWSEMGLVPRATHGQPGTVDTGSDCRPNVIFGVVSDHPRALK